MKLIDKIRNPLAYGFAAATVTLMDAVDASAADKIGDIATDMKSQAVNVGILFNYGMFAAGIFFVGAGLMKLKQAADSNGQQVKYGEGAWRLAAGAGLCAIPALTGTFQASMGLDSGGDISTTSGF
jgi:hypothetical protein